MALSKDLSRGLSRALSRRIDEDFPSGAFTPAAVTGLRALWDPSDLTTLFTDTAGTTGASVGQAVARINDKSGNGVNLIQATASKRPILRNSGSLYWLEFDGADDCLATSSAMALTDRFYFGHVTKNRSGNFFFEHSSNANSNGFYFHGSSGQSGIVNRTGNSANLNASSNWSGSATGYFEFYETSSGYTIAQDGTSVVTATATSTNISVSDTFNVMGRNGSVITASACDWYGGLIYDARVSSTDRTSVKTYMGAKGGLTL